MFGNVIDVIKDNLKHCTSFLFQKQEAVFPFSQIILQHFSIIKTCMDAFLN